MNEGRLFLYVSPTVAIPVFFLVLVATSLIVHTAILTNTSWFGNFWEGAAAEAAAPAAMEAAPAPMEAAPAMEAETAPAAVPATDQ
jgi:light-harvesting protein B-800-850 alpha chain